MNDWKSLSQLPADQDYWDRLGARIRADAHQHIESAARDAAFQRIAVRVSLAAAAAAVLVFALGQTEETAPATPSLVQGLGPSDPVAIELVTRAQPPGVSELLVVYRGAPE